MSPGTQYKTSDTLGHTAQFQQCYNLPHIYLDNTRPILSTLFTVYIIDAEVLTIILHCDSKKFTLLFCDNIPKCRPKLIQISSRNIADGILNKVTIAIYSLHVASVHRKTTFTFLSVQNMESFFIPIVNKIFHVIVYLFTIVINLWHQKFVTADVIAVFVNK